MTDFTRRNVLIGGGASAFILAKAGAMAEAQPAQPARTTRYDLESTNGKKMLALYEKAVGAMQDPAINYPPQPQSWTFQSYIHYVPRNPFDPAVSGGLRNGTPAFLTRIDQIYGNPAAGTPQAAWKAAARACWSTCTHSSPYFTIWHRWYMYYFERICRAQSGEPSFTLPYWNYASNRGSSLQLPGAFRAPQDPNARPGPLYFDDRGIGFATADASGTQTVLMNDGGFMPYSQTDYGPCISAPALFPSDDANNASFNTQDPAYLKLGFSGRLECVPHDLVHGNVGGWMGNVPSAAGDPIFYMHHCQVDRLFASWQALPGVQYNWGTKPTDPPEAEWKNQPASFVDETGKLQMVKLGDALSTTALGYQYDDLAKPPPVTMAVARVASSEPAVATMAMAATLQTGPFSVGGGGATVTFTPAATPQGAAPEAMRADQSPPRTLVLNGVKLLRRPRTPLSVFVNLPKGATPGLNSVYYVGTLNFFNFDLDTGAPMDHGATAGHADHSAKPQFRFDVGKVLQQQRDRGMWDGGAISVTITSLGAATPSDNVYVTFDSATLEP
jgi:tyrosinase